MFGHIFMIIFITWANVITSVIFDIFLMKRLETYFVRNSLFILVLLSHIIGYGLKKLIEFGDKKKQIKLLVLRFVK